MPARGDGPLFPPRFLSASKPVKFSGKCLQGINVYVQPDKETRQDEKDRKSLLRIAEVLATLHADNPVEKERLELEVRHALSELYRWESFASEGEGEQTTCYVAALEISADRRMEGGQSTHPTSTTLKTEMVCLFHRN